MNGIIDKDLASFRVVPNLIDLDAARASFRWEDQHAEIGRDDGSVNIGEECVDRHARLTPDRVALRYRTRSEQTLSVTYEQLRQRTSRFANVLAGLGVGAGERVFVLLGRTPELHTVVLGALKHRAVVCTLFAAFGPEPVRQRITIGEGRVLVTSAARYQRKVAPIRDQLPSLEHVLITGEGPPPDGTTLLAPLLEAAATDYEVGATSPDDTSVLHFTSGTTGTPKAAVHVHGALAAHRATARWALDLHPEDVYWCTADPGWVTGMSYGIIAPLSLGVVSIVEEGEFDAERWYRVLRDEHVSVWYTAPTAVRMMMRLGAEVAQEFDLADLRFIASVGEPLNPEAVRWGLEAFGLPIHDNWWQTETGAIMLANLAAAEIRPGSMGRPLPGIEAAVVRRDENDRVVITDGEPELISEPLQQGELALRPGWPSMFRDYLGERERYERCFAGSWYLSGDLVMRDADGWYWFVGRGDDVIKTAGHLVGPFEVESALMEHPAVAEAGVIGKPDPLLGATIKAFVVLRKGSLPGDELASDLIAFCRRRLGAAVAPREIEFTERLPKTRSGKIVRRLLRARELGLPEGDLSALEEDR